MQDFSSYLSPFTWRYAGDKMRRIWSEENKRLIWRQIWVALAETEAEFGLLSPEQAGDLRAHMTDIDIPAAFEREAIIHHDLMAELQTFAAQAPLGGKILHLGATSTDIEDNADILRMKESLLILEEKLRTLLSILTKKIETWADLPMIAFTHLQPAEPSTLGYRLAFYAQDLWADLHAIQRVTAALRGKGFKGAVGTGAAYAELVGVENLARLESRLAERLDLAFYPITTQVYPRRQDYDIICVLAGLGSSLYKFAFDLRLLQSPPIGEWSEPFAARQVGSSAMPFKRNPIQAEKINSLARWLAQMPRLAWDNSAHSLLERTLDDSANRRLLLPESFLICNEILRTATRICRGLVIHEEAVKRNLSIYAPFAASERLLMALGKAGADRQEMHERLRQHAMTAWDVLQKNGKNPLEELVLLDPEILRYLSNETIRELMQADGHLGDAPQRARALAAEIQAGIA